MASSTTDIQKIVVALSASDIVIEPGNVAQLVVTMTNRQEGADRLSIEVEGIDVEWYMIPVAAVNVAAGAQVSERILFKVAKHSANLAGAYPFLVRVQAMETGEVGMAQATLTVKPFNSLQVEIDPKRAMATYFHPLNDFDVSVTNMGNEDVNLQLFATDPADDCAYEFDNDHITLHPGQSEVVPLAIRPKVSAILGSTRLYQFSATARSVDDSYVAANVHGQIEKRALISPLLAIFALLILVGIGIYTVTRPPVVVPIRIHSFTVNAHKVTSNSTAKLSYDVTGSNAQVIVQQKVGDDGVFVNEPGEQAKPVGSVDVKPQSPRTIYRLLARGPNGQELRSSDITVEVMAPPPAPAPRILHFEADAYKVHPGQAVNLSWSVQNAAQLIIDPDAFHPNVYDINHKVNPLQDTTYTLRAIGSPPANGDISSAQQVSKSLQIKVVPKDVCLAEIASFGVKEKTVYIGGRAHLVWNTKYAATLHLSTDNNTLDRDLDPKARGVEVTVNVPTVFTLRATDSEGLSVTSTVTVTPVEKPIPPPPTTGGSTTPPNTTTPPAKNDTTP